MDTAFPAFSTGYAATVFIQKRAGALTGGARRRKYRNNDTRLSAVEGACTTE